MIWLFDIDGTLIRSGGAGSAAMAEAFGLTFGVTADLRNIAFAGRTDRQIIRQLFQVHSVDCSPQHVATFQTAYLNCLPAALKNSTGEVLAGVHLWLDRIEARFPRSGLGLLTGNMQASARLKLEHFGLWPRFAYGGYGDHHADRNEVAADAIRAAQTHVGDTVSAETVWIVGDTPHDIRCARSQGANVIAVATGQFDRDQLAAHEPDYLLADLSELSLLERLFDELA